MSWPFAWLQGSVERRSYRSTYLPQTQQHQRLLNIFFGFSFLFFSLLEHPTVHSINFGFSLFFLFSTPHSSLNIFGFPFFLLKHPTVHSIFFGFSFFLLKHPAVHSIFSDFLFFLFKTPPLSQNNYTEAHSALVCQLSWVSAQTFCMPWVSLESGFSTQLICPNPVAHSHPIFRIFFFFF